MTLPRIPYYVRVALLYALFGGLWILFSDRLLNALVREPDLLTRFQTYKGWGFVAVSASLIYLLLRHDPYLRRQAEAALRESENRYRLLFTTSTDAILLTTPAGGILAANPAACRIFGMSEEELKRIGRDGIVDQTDPRLAAALERRERTGSFTGEVTLVRSDGSKFPGEISTAQYQIQDGSARTSMIIRDVSERKHAEQALRDSEARFATVFRASPVGIGIARKADGQFVDANAEFLNLFGYRRDEVVGCTAPELEMWADQAGQEHLVQALDAQGEVRDYEIRFRRKGGEIRDGILSIEQIEVAGEQFILSLMRDTTERKIADEKIERQYQHLASLSLIDTVITSSFDLRVTLEVFLERVLAQLNVDAAAVLLLKPVLNTLEYAAGRGFRKSNINRLSLRLGEDYAGQAALHRRMISIPDLSKAERPFTRGETVADEGFVAFYAIPLIAKGEVLGVLEVFHRSPLAPDKDWLDFFTMLARQAAIAIDNTELFNRLQRSNDDLVMAYDETIEGWSRALDLRDRETEGHTLRVTEMAMKLARLVGIGEKEIAHVRRGALLHDIGKMAVPDAILLKTRALTDEEEATMRMHPVYAYDLLYPIQYLRPAVDIPHYHHEHWDGSGYPDGLKSTQIPLAARLFSVVDVWDALCSNRPYRPSWPVEKVRQYLHDESGKHFDPQMVKAFFEMLDKDK
jgi:PAS domain S-box-containing protein/putative nucleotidyltransferase with HDIG domain